MIARGQGGEDQLKLSLDLKVTNIAKWRTVPQGRYGFTEANGGMWYAVMPNSFGLPSGISCPGKTPFCKGCYGTNLENMRPWVKSLLEHNWNLLENATFTEMVALLTDMLRRYHETANHFQLERKRRLFRIHWDGDFFSEDYALAWATALSMWSSFRTWAYTRSFEYVPILATIPHLQLYLSVDKWNFYDAVPLLEKYPRLMVAGCGETYAEARMIVEELGRATPPMPCPENKGIMPITSGGEGACITCRLCPDGRRDILFAITKQEGHPLLFSPLQEVHIRPKGV